MSSYIIAGSADSIDTSYCEQIARRIQAKYKNIDFRIVIKHPSEWEQYLQEICRIYGFLKKSNPIVYTFDGKIIGNKDNFLAAATKYFGLDEQLLIVQNLTSKINMKLAEQEIKQKKIQKSNFTTLEQKIDIRYKELLGKGILKYAPKQKQVYLVNGIQYVHRQLECLVQPIKFAKDKIVPVVNQLIQPEDINLMALSIQDQVKPEEGLVKQAFMTEKVQQPTSQHDRFSEASKSKMHQSIVSYDKQSKGVKQSNKRKLKIDEQNDDVPDYIDQQQTDTVVCELADQYFVAFDTHSLIGDELLFYLNVDPNGNAIRLHNDGRPIKGHRVIIREVYYEDPLNEKKQLLPQIPLEPQQQLQDQIEVADEPQKDKDNIQIPQRQRKLTVQIQKSKTQPNIPAVHSQKQLKPEDAISQPNEELNISSHLNHHTLFIHKPLSLLELKNIIYFVKQTDTIATLQFLPENPNPKVKLHVRKLIPGTEGPSITLPIQRFISKQMEDNEFQQVVLPSENSNGMIDETGQTFKTVEIKQIGFNHLLFSLANQSQQKIHKVIKFAIDHFLSIEEQVGRDIGYNLILTKKYLLIVPLVEPYQLYNNTKLYLDGLAYLGVVHTALTQKAYSISIPSSRPELQQVRLRKILALSSGLNQKSD